MDHQTNLLLSWTYLHQEKNMDELRQSLMLTMELEETRLKAQEELKLKDQEIAKLKEQLNIAIKERDQAQENGQKLFFDKLILQQHLQQSTPRSGISSIEDDHLKGIDSNNGFSSSDCDESIVSSPHYNIPPIVEQELPLVIERPLPEKGKFLESVMKAGPLLQSLLLAGPMPQWRHPPPPLDHYQIPPPPVVIPSPPPLRIQSINQDTFYSNISCGRINTKRSISEISDSAIELK